MINIFLLKCYLVFVITVSLGFQTFGQHSSTLVDIKQKWLDSVENDSIHLERSLDYGFTLFYQGGGYLDTAQIIALLSVDLSKKLNNYVNEIASYNLLGEIYRVKVMADSAFYYSDLAIEIAGQNEDTLRIGKLIGNKANIYMYAGQLDEALSLKLRAHEIFSNLNDSSSIAVSLQSIASIYIDKREYLEAKPYAIKAYKWYGELFSEVRQSFSATSLGTIYKNLGKLDSAEYYFLHTKEHGAHYRALWTDNESYLAQVYSDKGDNSKALSILKDLVKDSNFENDDPRMQDYLSRLTLAYIQNGDVSSAENVFEKIDFDKIKGQFGLEIAAYEAGYQLKLSKSDYKSALDFYKGLSEVQDSVFDTESEAKFEEIHTRFETREKEQEIDLLNAQNELQQAKLSASKNTVFGLSVGLILLAGLLTWLYNLNKKVKKSRDEKDTLLREIHHRVKNNLQVISALLTLQSSHLKDAQAKTALQEGQDRVQSMALIHKDLYQHDNLKGVNTKDYLEQLVENLLRSYKIDESEVKLNLDIAEINLDVDTMIPMGLMVNELISNALKHAFKESENAVLDISLTEQNDQLKMTIADNGSGVGDIEEMKKQSFGYSLVQSFARKLDAHLQIESKDGLKIDLTIKNYKKV